MPLKQVPLRVDPEAYELICRAASHIGVSAAEFIRVAATSRAAFTIARVEPELVQAWDNVYTAVETIWSYRATGPQRARTPAPTPAAQPPTPKHPADEPPTP
jgi:hypothetical protein